MVSEIISICLIQVEFLATLKEKPYLNLTDFNNNG